MFNKQGLSHKLMAKWTEIALFLLFSMRRRRRPTSSHDPSVLLIDLLECARLCVQCGVRACCMLKLEPLGRPFPKVIAILAIYHTHENARGLFHALFFRPTSFALFFDMHFECLHHILYSIHPIQVRAISAEAISASDRITTLQQLAAENPLTLRSPLFRPLFFVTMLLQRIEVKWKFTKFMTFSGRLHHDNSLSFIV